MGSVEKEEEGTPKVRQDTEDRELCMQWRYNRQIEGSEPKGKETKVRGSESGLKRKSVR